MRTKPIKPDIRSKIKTMASAHKTKRKEASSKIGRTVYADELTDMLIQEAMINNNLINISDAIELLIKRGSAWTSQKKIFKIEILAMLMKHKQFAETNGDDQVSLDCFELINIINKKLR